MLTKSLLSLGAVVMLASFASTASANVIDSADVAGLSTFQDTNTGRIWLDMDNFFNEAATIGTSGNDMISTAINAGFTFGLQGDVSQLLDSLPLVGNFNTYRSVMGYGIPRNLIWGMYDDGDGNPYGYAYAFSDDSAWSYRNNGTDASIVENEGFSGWVDMGIWAYKEGSKSVPDTGSSLAFLGLGFLGLVGMRCRFAK